MASPPSPVFRYLLAAVLALVGFGIVTTSKDTSEPRLSRRARLVDLIQREDDRTRRLRAALEDLQSRLDALSTG
ncbi:MAG: hypothetical protein WAT66_01085, partial [Actinomycetota bacterium]